MRIKGIHRRGRDSQPEVRAAGVAHRDDTGTARDCLSGGTAVPPSNVSLNPLQRYRLAAQEPGLQRPSRRPNATDIEVMRHGITHESHLSAGDVLTAKGQYASPLLRELEDRKEAIYRQKAKVPLGHAPGYHFTLPDTCYDQEFRFGLASVRGEGAKNLVSPPAPSVPLTREQEAAHRRLQRISHHDYEPGEQLTRQYNWPLDYEQRLREHVLKAAGTGTEIKDAFVWFDKAQAAVCTKVVDTRLRAFKDRYGKVLGRPHDAMADTLKVPADHKFGVAVQPDRYRAAELIRGRYPEAEAVAKYDQERDAVSVPGATRPSQRTARARKLAPVPLPQSHVFGIPSIRRDMKPPAFQGLADTQNYGTELSVSDLLHSDKVLRHSLTT